MRSSKIWLGDGGTDGRQRLPTPSLLHFIHSSICAWFKDFRLRGSFQLEAFSSLWDSQMLVARRGFTALLRLDRRAAPSYRCGDSPHRSKLLSLACIHAYCRISGYWFRLYWRRAPSLARYFPHSMHAYEVSSARLTPTDSSATFRKSLSAATVTLYFP